MSIAQTSGATGAGNAVNSVNQTGSVGATGTTNALTITQDNTAVAGAGNTVGAVTQTYVGLDDGSDSNEATIEQLGNANVVTALSQSGADNTAIVKMGVTGDTANRNTLALLSQSGTAQSAEVIITGDDNGGGALNDDFVSLLNGVTASEIVQADSRNTARPEHQRQWQPVRYFPGHRRRWLRQHHRLRLDHRLVQPAGYRAAQQQQRAGSGGSRRLQQRHRRGSGRWVSDCQRLRVRQRQPCAGPAVFLAQRDHCRIRQQQSCQSLCRRRRQLRNHRAAGWPDGLCRCPGQHVRCSR